MNEHSPWICHVCDTKNRGESTACALCFKTTCQLHLKKVSILNRESGLYEIQPICLDCVVSEALG